MCRFKKGMQGTDVRARGLDPFEAPRHRRSSRKRSRGGGSESVYHIQTLPRAPSTVVRTVNSKRARIATRAVPATQVCSLVAKTCGLESKDASVVVEFLKPTMG